MIQSKEFWENNKMKRGDADNCKVRDWKIFETHDTNDIDDTHLKKQKKVKGMNRNHQKVSRKQKKAKKAWAPLPQKSLASW